MAFKEVASLDAEVTIAIGKKNKQTGKPYPNQAEGYYLGNRKVQNRKGESTLHFLQTPKGNLGVWGTTDLDRKLRQVTPGTMVQITFAGMKQTPNGDMYSYKVAQDTENTIEVATTEVETGDDLGGGNEGGFDGEAAETEDSDDSAAEALLAQAEARKAQAARVQALLGKKK